MRGGNDRRKAIYDISKILEAILNEDGITLSASGIICCYNKKILF